MSQILIGTSGYYYDDWKDIFYPANLKKEDYLSFLADHFNVVELNFSYYRIPSIRQAGHMLEKAQGRLEFVIKAFRQITHEISNRSINEILSQFLEGIAPFFDAGRLGAILLQFPQGFRYIPANRQYLKSVLEALAAYPVCVEFRHREWLKTSVYESLEELGTGIVCVDEPALPSLMPPTVIATSEIGYIRFHGRNKKNWYKGNATTRYDYLYTPEELEEWLPKISDLSSKTDKLYIFFNNHAKSQSVTNAKMLIDIMKAQGPRRKA